MTVFDSYIGMSTGMEVALSQRKPDLFIQGLCCAVRLSMGRPHGHSAVQHRTTDSCTKIPDNALPGGLPTLDNVVTWSASQ